MTIETRLTRLERAIKLVTAALEELDRFEVYTTACGIADSDGDVEVTVEADLPSLDYEVEHLNEILNEVSDEQAVTTPQWK